MSDQNKTQATRQNAAEFINQIEHPLRRADSQKLLVLFQKVTGASPVMWGESIIGFGSYHYQYESGREGDFLATGFAPRKANLAIYIMPGYQDFGTILSRLGKHKLGKACLYINKLADIELDVLGELTRAGLHDLNSRWAVQGVEMDLKP